MTMSLVSTVTVGSGGASSISFTSIPQDGTDLLLLVSVRGASSNLNTDGKIILNNNGSFIYNDKALRGNGSTASSRGDSGANGFINWDMPAANVTANTFLNGSFYFANYTGSSNKTVSADIVFENNATTAYQNIYAGSVAITDAINRITFTDPAAGGFVQYSTVSLYKITKGSDGTTVVS
jgi:hypothetical protein